MRRKKLRINIIGYGVVGKAQAFLSKRLNCEVFVFDPYRSISLKHPYNNVDLTFICTPERAVEGTIRNLIEEHVEGLYVIKSTTQIGTTKKLMKKYGVHISHNPEFLRQQHSYNDVVNPDRIIIGQCCEEHVEKLVSFYSSLKKPIYITDPTTSETIKLLSNAYLSMLITFWNEANELSQKLGLNIREVADLVCADSRMSTYGASKFGEPFGGKCLPPCLNQLINAFKMRG